MSNLKGTFQDASGNNLMPIPSDSAPIETSSTASQSYAVNDYFYYNNTLYKCTVPIAQGGTITPGTNCTATTTGGELSQLNSSLTASDNLKFRFATDGAGNYGYLKADDSFVPFSSVAICQIRAYQYTAQYSGVASVNGKIQPISGSTGTTITSDIISAISAYHADGVRGFTLTLKKTGYFMALGAYYQGQSITVPTYFTAGDGLDISYNNNDGLIVYLGSSDPTQ